MNEAHQIIIYSAPDGDFRVNSYQAMQFRIWATGVLQSPTKQGKPAKISEHNKSPEGAQHTSPGRSPGTKGRNIPARVGGRSDHVHIACTLPRTLTVANLVQEIKQSSSAWIKDKDPVCKLFEWQSGYGVFSIGESQLSGLIRYIDNQEHHHRERSFQDELLTFLNKYGVEYDERYLWD